MILTERLRLRRFEADDLPAFVGYRRHPDVARYQSWDTTFSMDDAERFLASQREVEFGQPGEWVQLAAVEARSGALVGDCAVRMDHAGSAEIGVTFDPRYQGRGLAQEALAALMSVLFQRHGIHRIHAEADERNVAVHRLLERLGFRAEAHLVESDWFKGEWCSIRIYAMLRREWEAAAR